MKKFLMTSTIIAGTAVSGVAMAELELGIGGYYKNGVIVVFEDEKAGVDQSRSAQSAQDFEIKFSGKFEMDNGITVFGGIEMDSTFASNNVQYDDVEFGFSGSFGKVLMGNYSNAHVYSMPGVAANEWDPLDGFQDGVDFDRTALDSDGTSIGYGTPNIGGFTAGIRYMLNEERGQTNSNTVDHQEGQGFDVGAGYKGSFGDIALAVGAAYRVETSGSNNLGTATANDNQQSEWTAAASVGFSGFTITGQVANLDNGDASNSEATSMGMDVGYKTGPWAITASYAVEDTEATTEDKEQTNFILQTSYAFGPGVKLYANAATAETNASGTSSDEEATIVEIGTQISF